MKKWILFASVIFLAVLPAFAEHGSGSSGSNGSGSGGGSEIRLRARLTGNAIGNFVPSGQADWRQRAGRFTRFSTEVEDVNLPADSELDVFVGPSITCSGNPVGTIILGPPPIRGGDLNLDTRDGDTVPLMRVGNIVSVCFNGGAVVSGRLVRN